MKIYLDCLPCLLNQVLKAARAATEDQKLQRRVLNEVAAMITELPLDLKATEIAQRGYRLVSRITGNKDPYCREKAEANRMALSLYTQMKRLVDQSSDKLSTACKLAIIGNSLDLGPNFEHGGLENIIKIAGTCPLAVNHYKQFQNSLSNCRRLLYLGDNAGEIVFDRLLIEELRLFGDLEIYFVVREKPVINDVTLKDALSVGMDKVATVVSSGSDAPATILSQCSARLQKLYCSADIIIAKGQGNYESLEGEIGNIFFFLRAKCPLVADLLGVNVGDCVLKKHSKAD